MIVVDASALIEVLRNGPRRDRVLGHFDDALMAPDLLVAEVLRFLAMRSRAGERVEPARQAFADLDLDYAPVWPYQNRIWELRENVSPYDASYVVLAEAFGCRLVTLDERLARAPGLQTDVIVA